MGRWCPPDKLAPTPAQAIEVRRIYGEGASQDPATGAPQSNDAIGAAKATVGCFASPINRASAPASQTPLGGKSSPCMDRGNPVQWHGVNSSSPFESRRTSQDGQPIKSEDEWAPGPRRLREGMQGEFDADA